MSEDSREVAIRRVLAEVRDWPAADFLHREAILKALCTCGTAWAGHPNPHATTCSLHEPTGLRSRASD